MPQEITVREASIEDVSAIQHVARAAWHAAYDGVLGPSTVDEQVDGRYRDDVVADVIEREDMEYLVAGDDGDIVGFASAGPRDQGADDCHEEVAELYTIYVGPSYWGEGVGSRLLDTIVDRLRADGYDVLRMCVLAANDVGRSFYESYGFPVIEEGTATIGGKEVDEVVYTGTL